MRWCVGIEDTAIGVPIRHSGRTLDEHDLTEHDQRYREDLDLAASLGIDSVRYGVPWYRINPEDGVLRWELADPIIEHALSRGIELIIDLVHYGVPAWVRDGFADAAYPGAIETYAGAFAERYGRAIRHYTPLNEPLITATFCGETGGWPPYLTGHDGWTTLTVNIARGVQLSTMAIRSAVPEANIVHVEAAKVVRADGSELDDAVTLERHRAWLPTDLIVGRVDERHPMWEWLVEHGATTDMLLECHEQAVNVDVIGVNFYPQYSVREFALLDGLTVQVAGGGTAEDLARLLADFAHRYGRPVAVTETSYDGDDESRVRWLRESVEATLAAKSSGVDVWGYTWWPLFDFVDWGIAAGGFPLEDFVVRLVRADGIEELIANSPVSAAVASDSDASAWLRRMGLWRLEAASAGLVRVETPVVAAMRSLIEESRGVPGWEATRSATED